MRKFWSSTTKQALLCLKRLIKHKTSFVLQRGYPIDLLESSHHLYTHTKIKGDTPAFVYTCKSRDPIFLGA